MSESPTPTRYRWTTFVCGMASYVDASVIVSWAIVLVIFQQALGLTPGDIGLLSGLLVFGTATGALVGGRLGDRFGRRPMFIVTVLTVALSALVMSFTSTVALMAVVTLAIGLAAGADLPVSLSTVTEAAPEAKRGRMVAITNILWLLGSTIPGILGAVIGNMGVLGAQIMLWHIAVAAAVPAVLRFTIPESDSWIQARDERRAGVETIRAERASIRDLFRTPYLVPFIGLLVYYAFVGGQGTVYGQYSTYLLVNVGGADAATASLMGLILLPVGILAAVLFYVFVGSRARFTLFVIGVVAATLLTLLPVIAGFSPTTFIIAIAGTGLLGFMGGDPLMKFWMQRSFPTLLRTTAQGTIIAFGRYFGAALAPLVPLLVSVGPELLFIVLAALVAIGGTVAIVVFRTRDSHSEFLTESAEDADAETVATVAAARS